mgnify:CR=1 FL=1
MSEKNNPDPLWLMLGEIRGDLKWLVDERRTTARRMDDIEAGIEQKIDEHALRLVALERFKIRIGLLTAALGVFVPTGITILAKKMGLI